MSRWRRLLEPREMSSPVGDIALVSANFGGIDDIRALPDHDFDAFYYTDAETTEDASAEAVASWTRVVVPDYPRHDFNPRLRGRYFKHQIHRLPEVREHRWLVWADSSIEFKTTGFIAAAAERLAARPPSDRLLVIPHPDRASVREEYEYIANEMAAGNEYLKIRYEDEKMPEQMRYFGEQGWDVNAPLWCGTFWIVENSEFFRRLWDDWWDQNLRFGMMDQLSLPVLLEAQNVTPEQLDVVLWDNEYFRKAKHKTVM